MISKRYLLAKIGHFQMFIIHDIHQSPPQVFKHYLVDLTPLY